MQAVIQYLAVQVEHKTTLIKGHSGTIPELQVHPFAQALTNKAMSVINLVSFEPENWFNDNSKGIQSTPLNKMLVYRSCRIMSAPDKGLFRYE